jgi:hypothetical protein
MLKPLTVGDLESNCYNDAAAVLAAGGDQERAAQLVLSSPRRYLDHEDRQVRATAARILGWPMFVVGRVDNKLLSAGMLRVRFASHDEAAEFISTLPGHEDGVYYLDGPER